MIIVMELEQKRESGNWLETLIENTGSSSPESCQAVRADESEVVVWEVQGGNVGWASCQIAARAPTNIARYGAHRG